MNTETTLADKTILVADDDAANRELIVYTLMESNSAVHVLAATDGSYVLPILESKCVDLILLDWEMPYMNGIEVLKMIKNDSRFNSIPVLMYTGVMTSAEHLRAALEGGAIDFIRKPVEPLELKARVVSILKNADLMRREKQAIELNRQLQVEMLQEQSVILKEKISAFHIQISRKNEILLKVKSLMDEFREARNPDALIHQIDQLIEAENVRSNFLASAESIDDTFPARIFKKHPNLTPAELRFCTLIKAGLGSKEIAQLLGVTVAAIDKMRYRIRKKINIDPSESFEKLVLSI